MKTAKISIIVPIYNTEKYLYKCIYSIVNQSYKNIEVILVNDGSTDNSLSICEEFANEDDRIIVIDKENRGVASARNTGLDVAKGDYIGFVDSDDYISDNMYEIMLSTSISNNADIVECGYYRVSENNNIIEKETLKNEVISDKYKCNYDYVIGVNSYHINCNKLYKREIIGSLRFCNYKYAEDFLFNLHVIYGCNKKVNISECLYFYVNNPKSAMNKSFNIDSFDRIKAIEMAIVFYKQKSGKMDKHVIYYLLYIIRQFYERLIASSIPDKRVYEEYLINIYLEYYPMIKKDIWEIARSKKGIFANKVFAINPKIYLYTKTIFLKTEDRYNLLQSRLINIQGEWL